MKKYQEALDWLRETTVSLKHNQAYNILQELIDQQKEVHVGDKVRFKEEYKVHTGNFFVVLIDDRLPYPYILVSNIEDIGLTSLELEEKYTTYTRDYDVAELHQIELGWINHD